MRTSDAAETTGAADASFEEFVAGASLRLFTMALLLTGYHRAEAEDLLQDALERAYRRWRRITKTGSPESYVRQILVNGAVDRWRRLRRHREEPLMPGTVTSAGEDQAGILADRDLLLRAMSELPPGQRAVLVLRYFADLSEAHTAATLGCSIGTVKSQSSRALARLREITSSPAPKAGSRDDHTADRKQGGGRG